MNIAYWLVIGAGVLAILYGLVTSQQVLAANAGNERMQQIASNHPRPFLGPAGRDIPAQHRQGPDITFEKARRRGEERPEMKIAGRRGREPADVGPRSGASGIGRRGRRTAFRGARAAPAPRRTGWRRAGLPDA